MPSPRTAQLIFFFLVNLLFQKCSLGIKAPLAEIRLHCIDKIASTLFKYITSLCLCNFNLIVPIMIYNG